MTHTYTRPYKPLVIAPAPETTFVPREYRMLPCNVCGDPWEWTEHHLNTDGTLYECTECGNAVEYHVNTAPPGYAIDL